MIRAVLFDIDGVLVDSFEANLKYFQDLMNVAGYSPPTREAFRPLFHLTLLGVLQRLTGATDEREIKRLWKMRDDKTVQYDHGLASMPEGADATARELAKTYCLGLVTSRIRSMVFEEPGLAKCKDAFSAVVAYEDTESHKPDPAPLLFAAEQLEVDPRECVYIGDVENDVVAAHAAGMKAIVFASKKIDRADAWTPTFSDLPRLIGSL